VLATVDRPLTVVEGAIHVSFSITNDGACAMEWSVAADGVAPTG